jgi:hypothetical protein
METREDILKELKEIAPRLSLLEKVNTYSVPESYFVDFKNMMLEQIKPVDARQELQVLAPSLLKLEKPLNAEMPAAYFADFKSKLLDKVRADEVAKELAMVAPRLSVLEKVNVFEVPANYFSAFPDRVLGDIQAQRQAVVTDTRSWIDGLNEMLDSIISVVFKPKYSMAFAGFATMGIMAVFMFIKVQQCNDLDCKFAQLSTDEINNYLDNKSDAYSDEVFEMNLDTKSLTGNPNVNSVHAYKDALNDVDDADLNDAIAD